MADNSQNSSSLMDCTNSTIYRLNGSEFVNSGALNESTNSADFSSGSSVIVTDNSHSLGDFSGYSQGDISPDSDIKDPFNAIFYHVSPLKDSTNITFYNRPLYENIIQVLGKEFENFPSKSAKTFRIKTHVNHQQCFLTIDRSVLSLCASGPGHTLWREKKFKKLSENMYKSFVRETNSVLNTSLLDQDNASLSGAQVSTQHNQSGLIINILEETAEKETPGVIRQELPSTNTDPQDTPVMRKISVLMEMIHSLQGDVRLIQSNIMTLTKEVTELASQALYQTVDETHIDNTSPGTVIELVNETELSKHNDSKGPAPSPKQNNRPYSEVVQQQGLTTVPNQQDANRPAAVTPINSLDGLQRTSTPKASHQQHTERPHTTAKVDQQPRPVNHSEPRSQPSKPRRNSAKKVLLMGDSVISPVNTRGLKKEVFKHSIPGAGIDHIFDQSNMFNMSQFSEIILFVGGNDASNGTDIEYFEELYEQVILNLKKANNTCRIYLCNMSPRSDTDVSEVNQAIHRLCQEHNLTMVDINKSFYDRQGRIIERYYGDDLIHLSTSGVKRLLGEINKEFDFVEKFENCSFKSRNQKKSRNHHRSKTNNQRSNNGRRSGRPTKNRVASSINSGLACYKCGETNHETSQCKFQEQLKCHYCGFWGHKSGRCQNQ